MYEILKAIAAAQGWVFDYGRKDFHNLYEVAEQKGVSHIFLDPVTIGYLDNDEGIVEYKTFAGHFMILFSSDVDEKNYEERYEKYIKPIVVGDLGTIKNELRCNYLASFLKWEITEIVNAFDYNFDGLIISYKISINE